MLLPAPSLPIQVLEGWDSDPRLHPLLPRALTAEALSQPSHALVFVFVSLFRALFLYKGPR